MSDNKHDAAQLWNVHDARYLAHCINGVFEELEESVMPAIKVAAKQGDYAVVVELTNVNYAAIVERLHSLGFSTWPKRGNNVEIRWS